MDQDQIVYIVVDRVEAPYRVLLYQPSIRFSLITNAKVLSLQQWQALHLFFDLAQNCQIDSQLLKEIPSKKITI